MVQWLSHSCQSSCFQLQKARVWIQQVDKEHLFGVNCIKRQNKEKPVGFFNKVCSNSQSLKLFFSSSSKTRQGFERRDGGAGHLPVVKNDQYTSEAGKLSTPGANLSPESAIHSDQAEGCNLTLKMALIWSITIWCCHLLCSYQF